MLSIKKILNKILKRIITPLNISFVLAVCLHLLLFNFLDNLIITQDKIDTKMADDNRYTLAIESTIEEEEITIEDSEQIDTNIEKERHNQIKELVEESNSIVEFSQNHNKESQIEEVDKLEEKSQKDRPEVTEIKEVKKDLEKVSIEKEEPISEETIKEVEKEETIVKPEKEEIEEEEMKETTEVTEIKEAKKDLEEVSGKKEELISEETIKEVEKEETIVKPEIEEEEIKETTEVTEIKEPKKDLEKVSGKKEELISEETIKEVEKEETIVKQEIEGIKEIEKDEIKETTEVTEIKEAEKDLEEVSIEKEEKNDSQEMDTIDLTQGKIEANIVSPKVKTYINPDYPESLRRRRIEGRVVLKILINNKGQVIESMIKESSGYKQFDDSARKIIKDWEFAAAKKDGQTVNSWVLVPVLYRLN